MILNEVELFKKLVHFSLEQLIIFLNGKLEDYKNNSQLKESKPIVYRENITVYEEEVHYIGHSQKYIDQIDMEQFQSVENYKDYILSSISDYLKKHSIPNVCYLILKEKIEHCWNFYQQFFS